MYKGELLNMNILTIQMRFQLQQCAHNVLAVHYYYWKLWFNKFLSNLGFESEEGQHLKYRGFSNSMVFWGNKTQCYRKSILFEDYFNTKTSEMGKNYIFPVNE